MTAGATVLGSIRHPLTQSSLCRRMLAENTIERDTSHKISGPNGRQTIVLLEKPPASRIRSLSPRCSGSGAVGFVGVNVPTYPNKQNELEKVFFLLAS
jgi:hypothetical protein